MMLYHLGTEHEKVVLFLDIIGFSELVKQNNGFDFYDGNPHEIALNFLNFYNGITYYFSNKKQNKISENFLWVSDSIVISVEIENANILIEDWSSIIKVQS